MKSPLSQTTTKAQTIKPQATISHQIIKPKTPLNQIAINHQTIKRPPNPIPPNQTKVVLIKIPLVVTNPEVAGVPLITKPVVVKAVAMVIVYKNHPLLY